MNEEWQCSICLRFLYKPVANYCGHMFCFWCHHQAMSPFSESTCPLCRSTYQQFPAVAWKVDNFLRAYFPDEYTARKAEIEEEEEQKDFRSPSRKILVPARSQPGHPEQADFECDCCHQLLYQPSILNCGHIVCSKPCLDVGQHSNSIASEGDEDPSHIPRICPWDGRRTPRPEVCKLIADFLDRNFPDEYNRRRIETTSNVLSLKGNVLPCSKDEEDEKKNSTSAMAEEASPSEDLQQHGDDVCPVEAREDPSSGAGVHRSAPISEGNAILMAWVRGETDHYPHYGIGCDVCGQYPIVGRRYKCLDCPEASGFDVCGACYDLGPELISSSFSGRFGQSHKLSHRLELIRPRITSLHLLKAANPDLSMDELLRYLNMSLEPASETQQPNAQRGVSQQEFAGEELHGEQDRQRYQEHVNNQDDRATTEAAAAGTERQHGDVEDLLELHATDRELDEEDIQPEDIAFGLRRGPRPVEDESAEWPSPSAPHNPRRPRSV